MWIVVSLYKTLGHVFHINILLNSSFRSSLLMPYIGCPATTTLQWPVPIQVWLLTLFSSQFRPQFVSSNPQRKKIEIESAFFLVFLQTEEQRHINTSARTPRLLLEKHKGKQHVIGHTHFQLRQICTPQKSRPFLLLRPPFSIFLNQLSNEYKSMPSNFM